MWSIETTDTFDTWFDVLDDRDKANVLASLILLQERGPFLSRPYADTVKGSCHNNMKELRVQSNGNPIRAFFAFDPNRKGIILCDGNKRNDKRFYDEMLLLADLEYTAHLQQFKKR